MKEKTVAEVDFRNGVGPHPDDGVLIEAVETESGKLVFDLTVDGYACLQVLGNSVTLRLTTEECAAIRFVIDRVEDKLRKRPGNNGTN